MMSEVKKFINEPKDVVTEMIEGMVETYPNLGYLSGFPEIKVLHRADVCQGTYNKVALISGGGSGHEPAHGLYVGEGMLTAAVCGDVFTSPTFGAILAAIRAVTGPPGCLLIVKNYTGDRLSFGRAAEQAKAEGFQVEMVVVADDCALRTRGVAGRRGLAGTLFVHKIAGAAAAAGLSLAEVAAEARAMAENVATMAVALSTCTIPGNMKIQRIPDGCMELGLGIHGEAGASVHRLMRADDIVAHVLKQIVSDNCHLKIQPGDRVALMVNGLGTTSNMELMILQNSAVGRLQVDHAIGIDRVFTGTFMTALDMAGVSITLALMNDERLARLDYPTKAPAWPVGCQGPRPFTTLPTKITLAPAAAAYGGVRFWQEFVDLCMPCCGCFLLESPCIEDAERPSVLTTRGRAIEAAIKAGAEALIEMEKTLNDWDRIVGDGDTGTTLAKGARAILSDLATKYPVNDAPATVHEIARTLRHSMGGTSGALYDIFFSAAYVALKGKSGSASEWSTALSAGAAAVSKYGLASLGSRTMLDALIPAATALQEKVARGDSLMALDAAVEAAAQGADSTIGMPALAGRSSYVSEAALKSTPDPGAKAAAAWLKAVATALHNHVRPR